jgi:hypothetical protein
LFALKVPKRNQLPTLLLLLTSSVFFFCKKSAAHIKLKKLAFLPSRAFFTKERRKKIHTHPCRKEGKKRLTRRIKRHLLSHIYSFTHQNVSSAQLIQSVNQCLGGASLFPFIIYFFLPFFFFSPGKKRAQFE